MIAVKQNTLTECQKRNREKQLTNFDSRYREGREGRNDTNYCAKRDCSVMRPCWQSAALSRRQRQDRPLGETTPLNLRTFIFPNNFIVVRVTPIIENSFNWKRVGAKWIVLVKGMMFGAWLGMKNEESHPRILLMMVLDFAWLGVKNEGCRPRMLLRMVLNFDLYIVFV
jgi:hypothetical protein